jgi:hypothetical protein
MNYLDCFWGFVSYCVWGWSVYAWEGSFELYDGFTTVLTWRFRWRLWRWIGWGYVVFWFELVYSSKSY